MRYLPHLCFHRSSHSISLSSANIHAQSFSFFGLFASMIFPKPVLIQQVLACILVGRSCLAAGIPARAGRLQEVAGRQHIICEEQLLVTKILILVPVGMPSSERCNPLTCPDSDQHLCYLEHDHQSLKLLHIQRNKRTHIYRLNIHRDKYIILFARTFFKFCVSIVLYLPPLKLTGISSTSSQGFNAVDSYSFVLQFYMIDISVNRNGRYLRKRQSGSGYVSGTGQAVNSCTSAVVYNLVNGQLFANTSNAATQFGTDIGVQYANFTPSASPGALTTVFSVDSQNNLLWGNTAFYNNAVRFCVLSDGTIVAVFIDPTQAPTGCLFVALSMTRISSCAGAAANGNFITGPSGPSGVMGATGASGIPGISGGRFASSTAGFYIC
jgi:hypothetical protein